VTSRGSPDPSSIAAQASPFWTGLPIRPDIIVANYQGAAEWIVAEASRQIDQSA
jgi:hypothetical protein